jgi:hypothetical protein
MTSDLLTLLTTGERGGGCIGVWMETQAPCLFALSALRQPCCAVMLTQHSEDDEPTGCPIKMIACLPLLWPDGGSGVAGFQGYKVGPQQDMQPFTVCNWPMCVVQETD